MAELQTSVHKSGTIPALSIRQPWAWLILRPDVTNPAERRRLMCAGLLKDIENRTWPLRHRGPLLIHAGRKFDLEGYCWVQAKFPEIDLPALSGFQVGGIVGQVTVANCVTVSQSRWFFGPYGFVLKDARPLPFTPLAGRLGLFEIDREVVNGY